MSARHILESIIAGSTVTVRVADRYSANALKTQLHALRKRYSERLGSLGGGTDILDGQMIVCQKLLDSQVGDSFDIRIFVGDKRCYGRKVKISYQILEAESTDAAGNNQENDPNASV